MITRCIGRKKRSQPDVFRMDMENDDDVFLLCTDGLTDMLADDEIQDILGGDRDLTSITEELVKKSNERGGVDNITVLVFSHHKSSV